MRSAEQAPSRRRQPDLSQYRADPLPTSYASNQSSLATSHILTELR
jgi:hypothetical protein